MACVLLIKKASADSALLPLTHLENLPNEGDVYLDGRDINIEDYPNLAEELGKKPCDTIYIVAEGKKENEIWRAPRSSRFAREHRFQPKMQARIVNPAGDMCAAKPIGGFSDALFLFLDKHGISDVDCYRLSNLDRKLFSKMRRPGYIPSKKTILAICIGCRLDIEESNELLSLAGYAFSPIIPLDITVKSLIQTQDYVSIHEVNLLLYKKGIPLLGAN